MARRSTQILIGGFAALLALGAAGSALALANATAEPYYPKEGLNEEYAATLVRDLTTDDPQTAVMAHFPASNPNSVAELVAECSPVAQAQAQSTVYSDVVPVNARVILDAPGLARCDMYLSWSESHGEAWSVHLTDPPPQDPLATPIRTPEA
ncbi:hypothetical protein [Rathayibacter sp. VKM Ac-2801]|uniref:hypothetical protein n=1 Tax=Rathayibacter sp. VKM Ac-2801 TaxID=2609255 RepID=UPI00131FB0EB|nr:hypothetical protein [Rathayibacter sp. VKM Ac-2801]QHC69365.1 hypothetical protein GSU45_02515 [Rathayibacter sp. VKM Ac-2801]